MTTNPTTELLSDEALERIEKRLELRSDHTIPRSQLPVTPEEEVAALCATVRALRDQLAQVRETLTALKNCQNKPVCGHCAALLRAAVKEQP